jgi:hypothetical protein
MTVYNYVEYTHTIPENDSVQQLFLRFGENIPICDDDIINCISSIIGTCFSSGSKKILIQDFKKIGLICKKIRYGPLANYDLIAWATTLDAKMIPNIFSNLIRIFIDYPKEYKGHPHFYFMIVKPKVPSVYDIIKKTPPYALNEQFWKYNVN